MYLLRFYNTKKDEYGALYFSENTSKAELCNEFYRVSGRDFTIKYCAKYRTIKKLLI